MQEIKVHIKASAEQFYDVLCNRTHHIATIAPEIIQSVQIHEGEWGSEGSIISWTYIHGMQTSTSKTLLTQFLLNFINKILLLYIIFCYLFIHIIPFIFKD